MSAQQTLHRTIYFCCYFSDALLLPIQVWFVSLKRECFKMPKQICTSVLRSTVSNFCSLWDERPLWFQHVIDAHEGRASHHKNFMAKGSFFGLTGAQCVFCHIWKSQYFHLTSLQLQKDKFIFVHTVIYCPWR